MERAGMFALTLLPALMVLVALAVWKIAGWDGKRPETAGPVRMASLNAGAGDGKRWWLGPLLSLLPLGGTAVLLASRWDTIPRRFPIHWGIDGRVNGWAERRFGSTFGMLILALVLVAGMEGMGALVARSSPGHEGRRETVSTTRTILTASCWLVVILLSAISLLPLAHDPSNLMPVIVMGTVLFSVGITGYAIARELRTRPAIEAGQRSTEGRFWRAGFLYYNPADSALMVPKRVGMGYTLNFGRPVAWLILGAILLIPLMLPLLMHGGGRR